MCITLSCTLKQDESKREVRLAVARYCHRSSSRSRTPSVPFGSGGSDPRDCNGCRCSSRCLRRLSVHRLGVSALPAHRTDGLPPFNAGVAGHGGRGRCWVETETKTRPINGCTAAGLSGEPST
ncbi:hypothetical protein XENOCAPTIV_001914 [Xenoophorus captivus]|uniref:Uncharacterized protein n=1 Tax=Xenoophorus captivus TaxID=1517983 RepID=A0ABV0QGU1_9TELE